MENKIEVKIKNYGLESIIITDNGSGIESENFEALCRKNWTSKLEAFEDLTRIGSFGFRGEALSSLCSVASVTVITATEDTKPMGAMLEYDEKGELKSQKPIAREVRLI
ncbi:DNA mismatch repair protein pms1 [Zancudomyces culisetae]|uniref:DNA mismatch repair protein pms1 n=1 Tax=Zancudomyces culisetae TaxID=1213189 RepID=A0A1R1PC23_ZANCU|nr:DNA mismatch repair protein pms1 [Zancudomyces culisetae]|eukprot:OMH78518.1 DNA mismatch repair protein pms1 [Zancudomyces culisetae]